MALGILAPNSISAGSSLAVTVTGFDTSVPTPGGLIFFVVGAPPIGSPAIPIEEAKNGEFYTPNDAGTVSTSFQILANAPPGVYGINAIDVGAGDTTGTTKQITITAPGTGPTSNNSKILLIVAAIALFSGVLGGKRR